MSVRHAASIATREVFVACLLGTEPPASLLYFWDIVEADRVPREWPAARWPTVCAVPRRVSMRREGHDDEHRADAVSDDPVASSWVGSERC